MSQLLLSAQRLAQGNVLQTGQLNVFEALKGHKDLEVVIVEQENFQQELVLEWQEVRTPRTPDSYKDLVGKKLGEYKFQYLGRFLVNGTPVEVKAENFTSRFAKDDITNDDVVNEGWVNCTWLVDFLTRAARIQHDSNSDEQLSWYEQEGCRVLELHRDVTDKTSSEQERFIFSEDLKELTWEHETWFAQ
ncbi:MAG: hypothetical protein ACRBFS_24565 [Aureispira sp.]